MQRELGGHEPRGALAMASRARDVDAVRSLLADGADVNARSDLGWTPLMEACWVGTAWLAQPYDPEYEEQLARMAAVVELLADSGAVLDVAADADHRVTALMLASASGARRTVELLLGRGADPVLRDDLLLTAHDYAVFENHQDLADILPHGAPRYDAGGTFTRETCPTCRSVRISDVPETRFVSLSHFPRTGFIHPSPYLLRLLDRVFAANEERIDDDEYHQETLYRCPVCRSCYLDRAVDDRADRWAPRCFNECFLTTPAYARLFLEEKGRADLAALLAG